MKFKGVAYVAGPYKGGVNGLTVPENIAQAEKIAIWLWQHGWAAICPHKNTAYFDGIGLENREFVDGDLLIVERCDIVVCTPDWACSKGAIREVARAIERDIPFYVWGLHDLPGAAEEVQ